jgi:hypothetical protein
MIILSIKMDGIAKDARFLAVLPPSPAASTSVSTPCSFCVAMDLSVPLRKPASSATGKTRSVSLLLSYDSSRTSESRGCCGSFAQPPGQSRPASCSQPAKNTFSPQRLFRWLSRACLGKLIGF